MTTDQDDRTAFGRLVIEATDSIIQGAFATHGPTLGLVELWHGYQTAWPNIGESEMAEAWQKAGRR